MVSPDKRIKKFILEIIENKLLFPSEWPFSHDFVSIESIEDYDFQCENLPPNVNFSKVVKCQVDARIILLYGIRKCEFPGCNLSDSLSYHHLRPKGLAGLGNPDNACLLCGNHHNDADSARILASEIKFLWPGKIQSYPKIREAQLIKQLIETPPENTTASIGDQLTEYFIYLIQLRCCVPQSEYIRRERIRAMAKAQIALAGLLTSGLDANLIQWDKSSRFQIDMLSKSAYTSANDRFIQDNHLCILAKHSLATNASARGDDIKAVKEVEIALSKATNADFSDLKYKAYLNRNAAVIHQRAGNASRADRLILKSSQLDEVDAETDIRNAEILLLRGDLSDAQKPINGFLNGMGASTPLSPIQRVIGYRILGSYYALSGVMNIPKSIDILNNAYALASENELGHQKGKIDHARKYFTSGEFRKFIKLYGINKMQSGELTKETTTLKMII